MPATARQFEVTESDLNNEGGGGGGAYAELEVPADYEITLTDVEDYDKRSEGKSHGWVFLYEVETPSGNTVEFKTYLSFGKNARWKILEVAKAHGYPLDAGINDLDPNEFIGDVVGATIDFPRDANDEPTSNYRELQTIFPLADPPGEEEPEVL